MTVVPFSPSNPEKKEIKSKPWRPKKRQQNYQLSIPPKSSCWHLVFANARITEGTPARSSSEYPRTLFPVMGFPTHPSGNYERCVNLGPHHYLCLLFRHFPVGSVSAVWLAGWVSPGGGDGRPMKLTPVTEWHITGSDVGPSMGRRLWAFVCEAGNRWI